MQELLTAAAEHIRDYRLVLDTLIMLLIVVVHRVLYLLVWRCTIHAVRVDGQHGCSVAIVVVIAVMIIVMMMVVVVVVTGRLWGAGGRQAQRMVANRESRVVGNLIQRRGHLDPYAVVVVL